MISELVTNAVLHGAGPVTVTLSAAPPDLITVVTDRSTADAELREPASGDEHGRGLGIVHQLSESWHVTHAIGSKTVIAVVRSTG